MQEPMESLYTRSKLLVLNFEDIAKDAKPEENIQLFFAQCEANGEDPRSPVNRQKFNDNLLEKSNSRYLVSRYGENRASMLKGSSIFNENRTIHLGVDVFSHDQETVYAPCDGQVIRVGNEPETHSFGHFLILKPNNNDLPYIFFGHLAAHPHDLGPVNKGEVIAKLGDFTDHENGGWSRHLHIQMLRDLPKLDEAPLGYASIDNFSELKVMYPDPMMYFRDWKVQ